MSYILGQTPDEIAIDSCDDYQQVILSLAKQAQHSIDIFTQDLDAKIYNNANLEKSILALSKKHPNTRVRILVQDSSNAVRNGHRLIQLAKKITSSVSIHKPSEKFKSEQSDFMIVDKIGFIHQPIAKTRTYKAKANFKSPLPTLKLLDLYNEIWDDSSPDIETRNIYL